MALSNLFIWLFIWSKNPDDPVPTAYDVGKRLVLRVERVKKPGHGGRHGRPDSQPEGLRSYKAGEMHSLVFSARVASDAAIRPLLIQPSLPARFKDRAP